MKDEEVLLWIEGSLRKDPLSQKKLYEHFSSQLFGVCLRYAANAEEAEDSLIDGFMAIFEKLPSFKFVNTSLFLMWMKKIMVYCAQVNYVKCKKHNYHLEIDEEMIADESSGASEISSTLDAKMTLELLQELPNWAKIIINLLLVDGFSTKEVAEMLNITEGTARSRLSKAKALFVKKMNEMDR